MTNPTRVPSEDQTTRLHQNVSGGTVANSNAWPSRRFSQRDWFGGSQSRVIADKRQELPVR